MTDFPVPRRPRSSACSAGAWTRRLVAVSALLASTGAFANGLTPSDEQRRKLACGAEEDRHPAVADVAEAQGELIRQILEQPRNLSDLQDVVDLLAAQIDNATFVLASAGAVRGDPNVGRGTDIGRLRAVRTAYLALRPAGVLSDRMPIPAQREGKNGPWYPSADRPGSVCERTCETRPPGAPYTLVAGTQKDATDLLSPPIGHAARFGHNQDLDETDLGLPTHIANWRGCRQRIRIEAESETDDAPKALPIHAPRRNWTLVRDVGLLSFPASELPACTTTPSALPPEEWTIDRCTGNCGEGVGAHTPWTTRTQAFEFATDEQGLCWIRLNPDFSASESPRSPALYRIQRKHARSPVIVHVRVVPHCPECAHTRPPDRSCAATPQALTGSLAPTASTPQPRSDACPATSPNLPQPTSSD